jgi:methyl-accepting chemotaxis protein
MPLVALYQDVRAFVITLAFVVVHHTVVTLVSPSSVFNHYAALNKPLLWACIHAAFVLGLVGVMMAFWKFAEQAQIEIAKASGEMSRTAADVDQVSQRLTASVEIQSLSVDMINDALLEAHATLEELKATNPGAVANVSEIFQAVQVMVSDLTEQQARNSALAAKAMSDLTAQASHLGSLVSVGAKA